MNATQNSALQPAMKPTIYANKLLTASALDKPFAATITAGLALQEPVLFTGTVTGGPATWLRPYVGPPLAVLAILVFLAVVTAGFVRIGIPMLTATTIGVRNKTIEVALGTA